jgi:Fur family transcriptional regulator, peroxide stress response regulator
VQRAETRRSRQRDLVLSIVRSTMDHPTADWVYRQARRRLPRISLGTVYRNLKQLTEAGLIREIHAGGDVARFDGNLGRHYHICCVGCGRMADLPLSVTARIEKEAGRATSFRILGHDVFVQGLCPLCQETESVIENRSHP